MVRSPVRLDHVVETVWPEPWSLTFGLLPLGTPDKWVHKDSLSEHVPSIRTGTPWNHLFHFQPMKVFVPSAITNEDWEGLVSGQID